MKASNQFLYKLLIYKLAPVMMLAALIVFGTAVTMCAAAEPIGQVKETAGRSKAINASGVESKLVLESPVYLMDRIVTAADSKIGIVFKDNTYLAVGPESDVTLDTYVYSPKGRNNAFNLKALKGIFFIIGGKIARSSDRFTTEIPLAILGVRGTSVGIMYNVSKPIAKQFNATRKKKGDLKLNPKYLYVVNFSGQSYAANPAGKVEMKAPGHFAVVKPAGKAALPFLAMTPVPQTIASDAPALRYTDSEGPPITLAAVAGGAPSLGFGLGPANQFGLTFSSVFSGMPTSQGGFSDALVDQMQVDAPDNPSSDPQAAQPAHEDSPGIGKDVDAGGDGGDGGGGH